MAAILSQSHRLIKQTLGIIFRSEVSSVRYKSDHFNKMVDTNVDCFIGKEDTHNGILVDSESEPCPIDHFHSRLQKSLAKWKEAKKRTVWFKVDRDNAEWIAHLVKEGFYFHHAKQQYVTLYFSLINNAINNIPPYAHTNLGVGAFIINEETNQVLVIKEKNLKKVAGTTTAKWKLPGGFVEPGESIPAAAEREVFEETGIKAKFKSLIGFRHAHGYAFGCSDIYVVARLIPESFDINKCNHEIAECCWMKIEEYANHPDVYKQNRFIAKKMMEYLENNLEIGLVEDQRPHATDPIWIYVINQNV